MIPKALFGGISASGVVLAAPSETAYIVAVVVAAGVSACFALRQAIAAAVNGFWAYQMKKLDVKARV